MRRLLLPAALICSGLALAQGPSHSRDPNTGLQRWQWEDDQLSLSLNQRRPDQTRGFFQGRGFSQEQVEPIAQDCLFQATLLNQASSPTAISVDLGSWQVTPQGQPPHPPKLESAWQGLWQQRGVSPAARTAFRWALFPSRQTFQPGDWNMGMITMGLAPGERFDLTVTWETQDGPKSLHLTGLQCAPDQAR